MNNSVKGEDEQRRIQAVSGTTPGGAPSATASKKGNYRNPPAEHRFKAGTSGNPNGRRPKKKPVLSFGGSAAGMFDRNDQVLLDVVSRPIVVREGNKTETGSGLEALYRSMLRNAAQGDAAVGRILLQLIERAESRRAAYQQEILAAAMQRLSTWNDIFYERELQGLPQPDVYPHPADIEINLSTGQVIFHGPVTKGQAANQKALEKVSFERVRRLCGLEKQLEADPGNSALKAEVRQLKQFEEVLMQMGQSNIRREVWKLARAAQAKMSNPPVTKPRRSKTQKPGRTGK